MNIRASHLLFFLLTPFVVFAQQISDRETTDIAVQVLGKSVKKCGQGNPVKNPVLNGDKRNPLCSYDIFTGEDGNGFVIVSRDRRAPKVIGYGSGKCDAANLPPQLAAILAKQDSVLVCGNTLPEHPSWRKAAPRLAAEGGKILQTAQWGQGHPYNLQTPEIDGEHCPTGCVATAMSIVMKYHNWPDCGRGQKKDFFLPEYSFNYETADFDYAAMKSEDESIRSGEISRLMKAAGIAVDTKYLLSGSGATGGLVSAALSYRFYYSGDCQTIYKADYDIDKWKDIIRSQIDQNLPLLYTGYTGSGSSGHMFVIDGYNQDDWYHVNWGWDGALNGYYFIDDLNGYDLDQRMVINVIPDRNKEKKSPYMVNDGIYPYFTETKMNFSTPHPEIGEEFFGVGPYLIGDYYDSAVRYPGVAMALMDENDNLIEILGEAHCNSVWNFECGDYQLPKTLYKFQFYNLKISENLPSENCYLQMVSRDSEDMPWEKIYGTIKRPTSVKISEIPSDWVSVTFESTTPDDVIIMPRGPFSEMNRSLKGADSYYELLSGGGEVINDDPSSWPIFYDSNGFYYVNGTLYDDLTIKFHYSDKYSVYDETTIDKSRMTIQDEIVYELYNSGARVAGYTQNVPEKAVIHKNVEINGNQIPVTHFKANALSGANRIKHIELESESILFGISALSRMSSLESILIRGHVGLWNIHNDCLFFKSENIKKILFETATYIDDRWAEAIKGVHSMYGHYPTICMGEPNGSVYYGLHNEEGLICHVPGGYKLYNFRLYRRNSNNPGYYNNFIDNATEMWEYKVYNDCFTIKPTIPDVIIDSVFVDEIPAESIDGTTYSFGPTHTPYVEIKYTVDGVYSLTTKCSYGFFTSWLQNHAMVDTLMLSESDVTVGQTLTHHLVASFLPEEADDREIKWTSSDETIAIVDNDGTVTGIGIGNAIITAQALGGFEKFATCNVTVTDCPIGVNSITLDKTSLRLLLNDKATLSAIVLPENATDKTVTWSSSNNDVASVDTSGLVTALAPGFTVITATCGNVSATCDIEVISPLLTGDADGNGIIDANDAVVMTNYYIGVIDENGISIEVSDINGDGVIDAQDALLVTNIYLGIDLE